MALASDLPAISVRRPYLALVINLLIVIAGLGAVLGVEVRELPDVDRPIVTVRGNYPGGSPETIDAEITSIVERAVARVNGIKEVRSSSEEDNFRVRAVFDPSTDLITAANDVREAISRVQRELPTGVEDLTVVKADADAQPIVRLAVSSDTLPLEEVTRQVTNEIIPELTSIAGVADVALFGERDPVVRVVLDPMLLASHRLTVSDVTAVLRSARFDVPAGSFKSSQQDVIVRANASTLTPDAVERLVVRDPVRIGDVAHAFFGPADAESIVRLDRRSVIRLGVVRRAQSNTVAISNDVGKVVEKLNERFKSLRIAVTSDDAVFINGAIGEVLTSLALAVLIVVAIVGLFIGKLRAALIPAVAIPVALIGAVSTIWLFGFSLNLITLLALVLASGLVVDDAIVVLENIERLKSEGIASRAAAVLGTNQVFFAVIATTATLASVFLPISFLPSTAGRLFTEFGVVLAVTVCISSLVALTLVPMLASRLPDVGAEDGAGSRLGRILAGVGRHGSLYYRRLLGIVTAAPLIPIGICAIVLSLAAITYQTLGEELVPEEDRGLIRVFLTGPDGVGLDYTDRQVEKVEAMLQPLVDKGLATGLFSITGRYDPNRGQVEAPLKDWSTRSVGEGEIAARLNQRLSAIPGARASVRRGNSLGLRNADGGVRLAITGDNYEAIASAAQAFVVALERDAPQVQNWRVEFRATQPQVSVQIDRRRATDLGVNIVELASTLRALVDNDEIAELIINDERLPIILQATAGAVDDPSDLSNLYVRGSDSQLVPLAQLITFKEYAVAGELDRHGLRRAVEIFGDTAPGYSLRQAVTAIEQVAERELPPSVSYLFLDEAAALNETSYAVAMTYIVALVIVFLVLVAQFESLASALVVLLTVPFGICAAIFALALTGTSINIYSQIGILMLIGIMAKNAILMVEFADQLRENGFGVVAAAFEASIVRLRPIVMTMFSTVFAGLPLILGSGPGQEARGAIGWVVFGGLGLAAVFTLLLTPALYVLIAGLARPRNEETERVDREMGEARAKFGTTITS
jgi:hydrophobic/amphiphilic exporter-1 (mainly G- bacteria), HAE1 family